MMKVASVSFWHLHGTDYARDAQAHPELDLVSLWDEDPERGMAGAAQHDIPFVADLDDILGDAEIDGVIVCNPTAEHLDVVLRCIRAGKHVFMEKVISASLAEASTIVQEARAAGVALVVSLWRSDRGYTTQIAELIESGVVGQVTSARVRDGHPFALPADGRPDGTLPDRFWDPVEAKGGVLIDLCHPLYLLARIIGTPQSVVGTFGHVTGRRTEDNAAVLLSYPNGAIGIAETSSVTRITPFTIEVHGTEGTILYSEPGIGALVAARNGEGPARGDGPEEHPRLRVRSTRTGTSGWQDVDLLRDASPALCQWVDQMKTGERGNDNLALGLSLSAIVEAAYESVAQQRPVAVQAV